MIIPFFDANKENKKLIKLGLIKDIKKVIFSGQFLFGKQSETLEDIFSSYFQNHTSLVGSGTDALILSLKALGIGHGDKVAIPALTAIPTAIAVKAVGADIVYIDVDNSLTIDPNNLLGTLNKKKISALIAVHLYGNTCNMGLIQKICDNSGIPIVEDCAQSFGSRIGNRLTGTIGECGAFSFYPTKNLGAFGDSGLIISKNKSFIKKIKQLRFYGQTSRYKMGEMYGINSRTDEIQAAVLIKKMATIEEQLKKRIYFKNLYIEKLKEKFELPNWQEGAVPHIFPIIIKNRKKLVKYLNSCNVETIIHYPFYLENEIEKTKKTSCPSAKKYSSEVLSIPFYPWLSDKQIKYLFYTLLNF